MTKTPYNTFYEKGIKFENGADGSGSVVCMGDRICLSAHGRGTYRSDHIQLLSQRAGRAGAGGSSFCVQPAEEAGGAKEERPKKDRRRRHRVRRARGRRLGPSAVRHCGGRGGQGGLSDNALYPARAALQRLVPA